MDARSAETQRHPIRGPAEPSQTGQRFPLLMAPGPTEQVNAFPIALDALIGKPAETLDELKAFTQQVERFSVRGYVGEDLQNQLQISLRLLHRAAELNSSLADRYKEMSRSIKSVLTKVQQSERSSVTQTEFDELFHGFTPDQITRIIHQSAVIQLTVGCGVGCPNCTFNALPGPRRHLSWDAVEKIVDRLDQNAGPERVFLYYSSDPLDWRDNTGRTYLDVLELFWDKCGFRPTTRTAIPPGSEATFLDLWRSPNKIEISVSGVNFTRLQRAGVLVGNTIQEWLTALGPPGNPASDFERTLGKNEALPYNTGKSLQPDAVEESISCRAGVIITPDGLYNMFPTRTTPYSPNGYVRYPLSPESPLVFWRRSVAHRTAPTFECVEAETLATGVATRLPLQPVQAFQVLYNVAAGWVDFFAKRWAGVTSSKQDGIQTNVTGLQDISILDAFPWPKRVYTGDEVRSLREILVEALEEPTPFNLLVVNPKHFGSGMQKYVESLTNFQLADLLHSLSRATQVLHSKKVVDAINLLREQGTQIEFPVDTFQGQVANGRIADTLKAMSLEQIDKACRIAYKIVSAEWELEESGGTVAMYRERTNLLVKELEGRLPEIAQLVDSRMRDSLEFALLQLIDTIHPPEVGQRLTALVHGPSGLQSLFNQIWQLCGRDGDLSDTGAPIFHSHSHDSAAPRLEMKWRLACLALLSHPDFMKRTGYQLAEPSAYHAIVPRIPVRRPV